MPDNHHPATDLSLAQRIAVWLVGIILCPLVAMLAINMGLSQLESDFKNQASLVHDELTRRYSTLEAVLTSLAGFHQASDYVSDVQFSTFAHELLSAYPYIRHALSLRKLEYDERKALEQEMLDAGYYQFKISELSTDGRLTPAAKRDQYLIINIMEPLPPQMGVLLGYDVMSNPGLANAVEQALKTGQGVASPVTRVLHSSGGMMIFKAVYQGRYTPSSEQDRRELFDGAIAIEVGAESLLNHLGIDGYPLDVQFRQPLDASGQFTEYKLHLHDEQPGGNYEHDTGSSLLPAFSQTYTMNLYGQPTELLVRYQLQPADLYSSGAIIAIFSCLAIYIAVINIWRHRRIERIHEAELQDYAARAAFSEENTDPVLRINDKGTVLYSNKPGKKILKRWQTHTGGKVPDEIHHFVGQVLRGDNYQEIEVSTDNTHYTLRFVASHSQHYVNVYGRDDTEQMRYEHNLMLAKQQAEAASIAKSRFMATISHEVRTPLNGVLGMLDLLMSTELSERQHKLTETALRSGRILLGLINDILDFSKLDSAKLHLDPVPFTLQDLIDDVIQIVAEPARIKRLVLSTDLPDKPYCLIGDDKRLRQVLINLVGNAVKFTEHGEVTLRVIICDETPGDVQLRFEVEDTGIGIAEDALPTIFDDFTQQDASTTRRFGGTGLGLAICRQLVELMEGDIQVDSKPGKGSVFTVSLRLPKQNEKQLATPQTATRQTSQDDLTSASTLEDQVRMKILLAEDNAINQEVASAMLEAFGYEVTIVEDGQLAIEALKNSHYDLVLMDCQMPRMDGFEAAAEIRKQQAEFSHIPIIALTADVQAQAREQCRKAGMNDYLSKPFSSEELQEMILKWSP